MNEILSSVLLVNPWVLKDVGHALQVLQDVGWVGHAESQPATFRYHLHQLLQ